MKIAIIGAGSIGFTQKLVRDVLTVPELRDVEFALHDISARNLDLVAELVKRDIAANKLPTRVSTSTDRRRVLDGAKYILCCVRIGGLEAFETDITIPLRHGVDQCVGDTLCAGGIMYGQRTIPRILEFCSDVAELAETDAWFLNYANPMAMNIWAANDYGRLKNVVGLCHGVQHGWHQIATVLGLADPHDLDYVCAGINHQTWYTHLSVKGRTVGRDELLQAFDNHPEISQQEKVRIDVLRRFGVYSTESNGHLSEYLPWYRKSTHSVERWIDRSSWINGETGGYLRHCREQRNWFDSEHSSLLKKSGIPLNQHRRSEEHASYIIEAIELGRVYRGHFNVRNQGVIRNLPSDCVIEAPGFVDRFGINMVADLELPMGCAATCTASINVQRMAVRAAVEGDLDLLRLAVLHDPLVGAVCEPDEVWAMVDEMLVAQAEWLPQYAGAVAGARKRMAHRTPSEQPAARGRQRTLPTSA